MCKPKPTLGILSRKLRTWTFGEHVPNCIPKVIGMCRYSQSTQSTQELVELLSQHPPELEPKYGKFSTTLYGGKESHFFPFLLKTQDSNMRPQKVRQVISCPCVDPLFALFCVGIGTRVFRSTTMERNLSTISSGNLSSSANHMKPTFVNLQQMYVFSFVVGITSPT